jgi:predicted enzyme related to lactoylglutathione lyase
MIKFQSAVIFVKDISVSKHFYAGLLQQKISMDHGPNVGFEGGFAIWQNEHALGTIYGQVQTQTAPASQRMEFYFEAEDLDREWDQLMAAGVKEVHAIREQPWGQRVFRVLDPDQNIVELGEPLPVVVRRFVQQGLKLEEIAGRMSMPVEVVSFFANGG